MSWPEFCEWMILDGTEPLGDIRSDLQAAIIASTVANVNRPRGQKSYSPVEFMPKFEPETPQQRAAKLHAKMKAMKARYDRAVETEELKKILN